MTTDYDDTEMMTVERGLELIEEDKLYFQNGMSQQLAMLFTEVRRYVLETNDDEVAFGNPDNAEFMFIPMPVELVSIDSPCRITCFDEKGYLVTYDYQPWYEPGGLYEPPDHGIEFDWHYV
jgi:hypothetical protein